MIPRSMTSGTRRDAHRCAKTQGREKTPAGALFLHRGTYRKGGNRGSYLVEFLAHCGLPHNRQLREKKKGTAAIRQLVLAYRERKREMRSVVLLFARRRAARRHSARAGRRRSCRKVLMHSKGKQNDIFGAPTPDKSAQAMEEGKDAGSPEPMLQARQKLP